MHRNSNLKVNWTNIWLIREAINLAAGEQIAQGLEFGISKGAEEFQAKFPSLTEEEARHLAGGSMMAIAGAAQGSTGIKQVLRNIDKKHSYAKLDADISKTDVKDELIDKIKTSTNDNTYHNKGDISLAKAKAFANSLPDTVPAGRIDYSEKFIDSLDNFIPETVKFHNGKVESDLYVLNFHDNSKPIGFGSSERTMSWATHITDGNKMPTINDIHQRLALVDPDWGQRNAVSIIKIPAGTDVTFFSGRAIKQFSETGDEFKGGGFQIRFKNFDEKWVVETRRLGNGKP